MVVVIAGATNGTSGTSSRLSSANASDCGGLLSSYHSCRSATCCRAHCPSYTLSTSGNDSSGTLCQGSRQAFADRCSAPAPRAELSDSCVGRRETVCRSRIRPVASGASFELYRIPVGRVATAPTARCTIGGHVGGGVSRRWGSSCCIFCDSASRRITEVKFS